MGDCEFIEVIDGMKLIDALQVVHDNFGKYGSIKVCRAAVDENEKIVEEEKALFEISNFIYDERNCIK